MKERMRPILTLILAIMLVFTSVPVQTDAAVSALGRGRKQEAQTAVEEEAPAEEAAPAEEPAAEEEAAPVEEPAVEEEASPAKEPAAEEPKEEITAPAGTEADQADETVPSEGEKTESADTEDVLVEDEAVEPAPEAEDKTAVNMPAQTFRQDIKETVPAKNAKGKNKKASTTTRTLITVEVDAPEGAFPKGTTMSVTRVGENDKIGGKRKGKTYRQAIENATNAEVNAILAVDITFTCNRKEIEPDKEISVSFKSDSIAPAEGQELSIVHVADNESAEVIRDAEIDEENQEATFDTDSFSVYAIIWTADDTEQSATIHWGTYNGGVFEELESPATIDSTASSVKLDVIFDGYYYVGAEYKETESADGVNLTSSTLKKADGGTWQVTLEGSGATAVADGSHIYVNYAPKNDGQYTPPLRPSAEILAPETDKTVTDNKDGTYTIQLDITGKQDETVTQIGANVIIIMDITQSMTNAMPGSSMSRMAAAKQALTTLVNTLDPDTNLINFTAVNFGNSANATLEQEWTSSKADMLAYVNGLPDNPNDYGTCWQAGLAGGVDRANIAHQSESLKNNKTYVLFVTDGNPNCYTGTDGRWHGSTGPNFNQQAYDAAVPNANTLATLSELYGIFVGDAEGYNHLDNLITNANGKETINGNSPQTIEDKFNEIAQTIVNELGAGSVVVDDGIPTLSNVSANVSAGEAGGFEYYITPKGGTQQTWADAPGATYSNSNGVTWNLSEAGTLKNDWVYTLKFTVWPSQAAYDLIADLNNGKVAYDDLTDEQKASVEGSKESGYTLKTNTHLYTTFRDLEGNEYSKENDASAKAMPLPTKTISVEKLWHNYLDSRNDDDIDGLKLMLTRDGEDYLEIEVNQETDWKKSDIYISCGQIVGTDVKEIGHDYYVTELPGDSVDKTDYWEVNSPVYHPMVIDGVAHMLVLDENAAAEVPNTTYLIRGKYYTKQDDSTNMSAINERVSWLNLTKTVEPGDDVPADALFTYKVKITEVTEGSKIYFSVRGGEVNYRDDIVTTNTETYVDPSTQYTYYVADSGEEFTLKIQAGWNVRFLNLESGSTYTIEEVANQMEDGFVLVNAKAVETFYSGYENGNRIVADGYPKTTDSEIQQIEDTTVNLETGVVSGKIHQTNTDYSVTYTNKYLGVFYVYHSSDNSVERYPMAVKGQKVTGFNIYELTAEGTLYGGYFSDYAGKSSSFDPKALDYSDGAHPKDEGGTAYSYSYIKESNRGAWNYSKGYNTPGTAMNPETDEVYYLKEVPAAYILPYTQYTYTKADKVIRNMWFISATDDLCYGEAGFYVETIDAQGRQEATFVDTLTVTTTGSTTTVTLSPKSVFGNKGGTGKGVQTGYLTYWDASEKIKENATSIFTPYWLTKDGMHICGTMTRTINFNNGKVGSGGMRTKDAENSTRLAENE